MLKRIISTLIDKAFSLFHKEPLSVKDERLAIIREEDPDIIPISSFMVKKAGACMEVYTVGTEYPFVEKLIINHCEFSFHNIYKKKGVWIGELGSQSYQLNSDGVPVSHGAFDDEFEPIDTLLPVGESDYFECYAQKTFLNKDGTFQLGEEKSLFRGFKSGATYKLLTFRNKVIKYKGKALSFHEVYLNKDNEIIGTLGATEYRLTKRGKVIEVF